MKKIVMFEGGVETLAYFSKQMAEQFVKMGYAVFFYNLKDEKGSAKRLRKFIKPGETVMITFNFQGLEKEDGVYSEKSGYVWDEYKIPCYNIAADHPYYYDNALSHCLLHLADSSFCILKRNYITGGIFLKILSRISKFWISSVSGNRA